MTKFTVTSPSYGNKHYHFCAEFDHDAKKGFVQLSKTDERHIIEIDDDGFNELLTCLDVDRDVTERHSGIDVSNSCKSMGVFQAIDSVWRHFKPELFEEE